MTKQTKLSLFFIIFFVGTFSLSGCMNVATTGAQAVYNHHNIQKNLNDQYISLQAYKTLNHNTQQFRNANIAVATFNGEVLLSGQVPNTWQKIRAEQLVKKIPSVKEVYNTIDVAGPSSFLIRISDAWITTKIKSQLIAIEDLDASQIKVVTENGTVYLMGTVLPEDATAAIHVARETEGVRKVVKLFSYVTISKHLS